MEYQYNYQPWGLVPRQGKVDPRTDLDSILTLKLVTLEDLPESVRLALVDSYQNKSQALPEQFCQICLNTSEIASFRMNCFPLTHLMPWYLALSDTNFSYTSIWEDVPPVTVQIQCLQVS